MVADLKTKLDVDHFSGGLTLDQGGPKPGVGAATGTNSDASTFTVGVRSGGSKRFEDMIDSAQLCQSAVTLVDHDDNDDDEDNSIDLESLQERVEKIEIAIDVVRGRDSAASGKRSVPSSLTKKVTTDKNRLSDDGCQFFI